MGTSPIKNTQIDLDWVDKSESSANKRLVMEQETNDTCHGVEHKENGKNGPTK
jgi:hypothetical protein